MAGKKYYCYCTNPECPVMAQILDPDEPCPECGEKLEPDQVEDWNERSNIDS